jgi:hypothetical protein
MAAAATTLTDAQAQKITTAILGEQSPTLGSFPWPRLEAALGVQTAAQAKALGAQALLQTGHTDAQIKAILVLPHGASVADLIKQDLTGALIAFGAGAVGAGAGAAADAAASAAAADGTAAAGSGAAASQATGYTSAAIKGLSSLSAAGGLAALLVDPRFLLRMAEVIGGFVLVLMGIRFLANAGGANIGNPIGAVGKAATVAAVA